LCIIRLYFKDEDIAPVIIINNDTRGEPKFFFYGQNNNVGNNCYEVSRLFIVNESIFSSVQISFTKAYVLNIMTLER